MLSTFRTIKVLFKLLPILLALRKDRREWVKTEGKNVDVEKYRKNAKRILKTFIYALRNASGSFCNLLYAGNITLETSFEIWVEGILASIKAKT